MPIDYQRIFWKMDGSCETQAVVFKEPVEIYRKLPSKCYVSYSDSFFDSNMGIFESAVYVESPRSTGNK